MNEPVDSSPRASEDIPDSATSTVATRDLPTPCAALRGVSKTFGATRALTNMTVELRPGRVVALVGENGAGKSTSVKTLSGLYKPDGGRVEINGEVVELTSPLDARARGIAVVSQHPSLFPELSLTENIFAGQEIHTARGLLDHSAMATKAKALLARVGLGYEPATLVSRLSTSEHQMLEIAKALAVESRILILDEPTATLSSGEVQRLFGVINALRDQGVAMLFVGHRLEEIFDIADDLVIMRDGQLVHTCLTSDLTPVDTIKYMVGRELGDLYPERTGTPGDVVLKVSNLTTPTGLEDVSLQVREGEIVGMAGLVGSGRTELAKVIFGIDTSTSGTIELDGTEISPTSSAEAMSYGVAYVSEDRRGQSVIEEFDILENSTLPVIAQATKNGLIGRARQIALISEPLSKMSLRFASYGQTVATLSGGNQQKVVIAKWLATNPRLLILDEPTQGIDVGAKAEVHRLVVGLAEQGIGVLMISSDLPEVLGMSDRVLVMRSGKLVAEFSRDEATEENVARAATGASSESESKQASSPETAGSTSEGGSTSTEPSSQPSLVTRLMQRREIGLLAVLIAVAAAATIVNSNFLTYTNLSRLAAETSLVAIVALGQYLVILTRNIDVSVASTIGLTAYIFGDLVRDGTFLPLAIGLTLILGVVLGMVNGLIVAYGRVPSIVVTLGTLYVYRGIGAILSDGDQISAGTIPSGFANVVESKPLGIPMLAIIFLVLAAGLAAFLTSTSAGRQFFQVGSNPEGARALGLNVERKLLTAFVICGVLGALTGVLWATHYGAVDGQTAYGEELRIIAAVVVGGVALRGGRGTVIGVALGALVLFTLYNALTLARVDPLAIQAFYGAAIILAVGFDSVLSRRSAKQKTVI